MPDLRDELRAAMESKGYTYLRLLQESGIECDISSLNRKLNGAQELDGREALKLARVLGVLAGPVDRAERLAEGLGGTVSWAKHGRGAS